MKFTILAAFFAATFTSQPLTIRAQSPTPSAAPTADLNPSNSEPTLSQSAQRGPVKLTVSIDRASAKVPEPITLKLTLESESGVDATFPDLGEIIGPFTIKSFKDADPISDGLNILRERTYDLESVLPGDSEIPAISLTFTDPREKADGSTQPYTDTLTTQPIPVSIAESLADIRGPLTLADPRVRAVIEWIIGILIVLALISLIARKFAPIRRWLAALRRKLGLRPTDAAEHQPSPEPAHLWALRELDRLAAEHLIERGQLREFYYRINTLLRTYIERRFSLLAGEQTSEEFLHELQRSGHLDESHKQVLRRFVAACDPVKYAKHRPDPIETDWVQAAARELVLQTAQREPGSSHAEPSTDPDDNGRPDKTPFVRMTTATVASPTDSPEAHP